ncbi:peroxiredoxin [Phenylobacterium sp. J367]|uniref:peroxiredoxin family protein n=1 Tax=Phenylobacterium sp. J367 TaxID=2898435 RepID=UPI002150BA16|nr:redoxin domain-containing protein [Phenylobacterium sp. J367]MCR5879317.1 redoxin domain-containing protein [Phenylobacterium sp. J367]
MTTARLAVLGLVASTALVASCTTDNPAAPNALAQGSPVAASAPAQVDNFMLVDQDFEAHELYRLADARLIAIVSHATGDAEVKRLAPALTALRDRYAAQGVEVLLINSNLKDGREAIAAEGLELPVLMDVHQLVGEQLGVTRSAELLLVDPKTWTVTYRGAAADADAAVAAVLAGQAPRRPGPARGSPSPSPNAPARRSSRRSPTPRTSPRSSRPTAWPATPRAASAPLRCRTTTWSRASPR